MVDGGSVDQTRTFYSCLYRMLFFPNKMYELMLKPNSSLQPLQWESTAWLYVCRYWFLGHLQGLVSIP
jgi:putative alpha-1,2-mannosidase